MSTGPLFAIGTRVRLIARPESKGRVIETRAYARGFQYLALIGDEENWYAESDLQAVEERQYRWQNRDSFLRDVVIAKMQHPIADSLYAYRASRTMFEAYQFRPALKFLRQPEQRILIADEVGLGKTIEAAIIYLELKARADISRVLVLCPARLKMKWISEFRNRFDEEFEDLGVEGLHRIFDQHDRFGSTSFRAVASYETLRREDIVEGFDKRQIQLDLLIADEAHYMRNSGTATYRLGTAMTDLADAVVFLTATPLHLGNDDLFHLMHLLLPSEYDNAQWFDQQIRPNAHINRAAQFLAANKHTEAFNELRKVEGTFLKERFIKNPYYQEIIEALKNQIEDRATRVHLQRDLLELNTLSTVFTRTRKREVVHAAVRAPVTVNVQLTPEEMAFYQGIVRHVRLQLSNAGSSIHSFTIISRERMAASCLAAMREMFEEKARLGRSTKAHLESSLFNLDDNDDTRLTESTEELRRLSRIIGNHDSKFELFSNTLDQAFAESSTSKALVFSFFRRTLDYLYRRLCDAGYTVEVIHGGVTLENRQEIIERFRTDPKLRVLLSSEVGAEGLDFQFCDVLMNYDLPWNPMQVEQRIGRLDRFGQKHPRIRIYNFFIENTIESRIFQRLYDRINIFKTSVGDLEDILGEQIRSLSKKVLQKELTPQEEILMADQAADQIIERQRASEELESKKDEFMGQDAIFSQQVNDAIASGRIIHAEEVRALVETFLHDCFGNVEFTKDEEEPTYTLTVSPRMSAYLNDYVRKNPSRRYTTGLRFKEAIGRNKQIALTFDADLARERNLLEFVTHQHLLASAAFDYWNKRLIDGAIPATRLTLEGYNGECGDGYFFIYALDEYEISSRRTLYPVIVLDDGNFAEETAKSLLGQLHKRQKVHDIVDDLPNQLQSSESKANNWMAEQRDQISFQANKRHKALMNIRENSITQSFNAKIRRAENTAQAINDIRIRRLYEGQIRNLVEQREIKLKTLHEKSSVIVSHTLIAAGRVYLLQSEQENESLMFSNEISISEQTIPIDSVDTINETEPIVTAPSNIEANSNIIREVSKVLGRIFQSRK